MSCFSLDIPISSPASSPRALVTLKIPSGVVPLHTTLPGPAAGPAGVQSDSQQCGEREKKVPGLPAFVWPGFAPMALPDPHVFSPLVSSADRSDSPSEEWGTAGENHQQPPPMRHPVAPAPGWDLPAPTSDLRLPPQLHAAFVCFLHIRGVPGTLGQCDNVRTLPGNWGRALGWAELPVLVSLGWGAVLAGPFGSCPRRA